MTSPQKIVCIFTPYRPSRKLAEACMRLSPKVSMGLQAIFIDVSGCDRLYTHKGLLARIQVLLARFEVEASVVISSDIGLALAQARHKYLQHRHLEGSAIAKENLPIDALCDFCCIFNEDRLRECEQIIKSLKQLGVENLGAFSKLPSQSLSSRFQRLSLLLYERVQGFYTLPWPNLALPNIIHESLLIDESLQVQSVEPLIFLIRPLLEKATTRMHARGQSLTQLELKIEQEKYSTIKEALRCWKMDFSIAQSGSHSILRLIQQRLELDISQKAFESPITKIEVFFQETQRSRNLQSDFFDRDYETQQKQGELLERLRNRLGSHCVFQAQALANYIPEKAWAKSQQLEDKEDFHCPLPKRPLRLLSPALGVSKVNDYLLCKGRTAKIIKQEGPERLQGYWWQELFARDYYTLTLASGESLWVYKRQDSQDFYLHGVFD